MTGAESGCWTPDAPAVSRTFTAGKSGSVRKSGSELKSFRCAQTSDQLLREAVKMRVHRAVRASTAPAVAQVLVAARRTLGGGARPLRGETTPRNVPARRASDVISLLFFLLLLVLF